MAEAPKRKIDPTGVKTQPALTKLDLVAGENDAAAIKALALGDKQTARLHSEASGKALATQADQGRVIRLRRQSALPPDYLPQPNSQDLQ